MTVKLPRKRLLHVGCGRANLLSLPAYFQTGEWDETRLDIDASADPDIVGSILDMGLIESEIFDALYSSHNLEHVYPHEVGIALSEFQRVLRRDGVAMISCPDIQSVAQAVAAGNLMEPLYEAPAGPVSAIDILYGYRPEISSGKLYMAHKTGFTSVSLATQLKEAGFETVLVARDSNYGLHALAYRKNRHTNDEIEHDRIRCMPDDQYLIEVARY